MTDTVGATRRNIVVSIVVCLALVAATSGVVWWIDNSEPKAQRETATRKSPMLVTTVAASKGDYRPLIEVLGRVDAAREVMLRPRVEGEVIAINEQFEPGAIVKAGEVLVRLDPSDFEIALISRQSELKQAEADMALEQGRQQVAHQEYALAGEKLSTGQRSLVLREPQLLSVQARVEAAVGAVLRARLDMDRTTITAPFTAHVIERMVTLGSQVERGEPIARLVGIEEYWVIATVPLSQLMWIQFGADGSEPSAATIRKRSVWGEGQARQGKVLRYIGALNEQTRLVRVLISVADPLARNTDGPPLLLDTIVQTVIEGRLLRNVVRLERQLLRQGDTVWVMQDGRLSIKEVEVVFRDADYAYIASGLEDGEMVVRTTLSQVRDGAELRKEGDD